MDEQQIMQSLLLRAPEAGATGNFDPIMREALRIQNLAVQQAARQPDTSQLRDAGFQREMRGMNDQAAGLAMATALPSFQPMAQATYKRGVEATEPIAMGEGLYMPGMGYVADPYKQQDRLTKAMAAQAGFGTNMATAYGTQEHQRAVEANAKLQLENTLRHQRALEGNAAAHLKLAQQTAEMGKIMQTEDAMGNKSFVRISMTPQGPQLVPMGGASGPATPGAPAAQTPDILPKHATTEERNVYAHGAQALAMGANLLERLQDPKLRGEFGLVRGGLSEIQAATGLPVALGSAQQQQLRATIMAEAYKTIHALAGATLAPAEKSRIIQFAPGPRDSVGAIEDKLRSAMEIAAMNRSTLRRSYGLPDVERYGGETWGSTGGASSPGAPAAGNPGARYGWKF